jgi:hypothetical protein
VFTSDIVPRRFVIMSPVLIWERGRLVLPTRSSLLRLHHLLLFLQWAVRVVVITARYLPVTVAITFLPEDGVVSVNKNRV